MMAWLADVVLVVHLAVVLFVIGGLLAIVAGNLLGWPWVNGWWFRGAHVAAIATVVVQSWLGIECPLTTLEAWLRVRSGTTPHGMGFIAYWVQRLLFYQAPLWLFVLLYTGFGALVAAVWWLYPPRRRDAP